MKKRGLTVWLALSLLVGVTVVMARDTIRIGWTAWADAEFVTKLAAKILDDRLNYQVELIQSDVAVLYQRLARGDIDVMLMSWQPVTHAEYLAKICADVEPLGILYTHVQLGWVAPNSIPVDQIIAIDDLRKDEVKDKLQGMIIGIDPGAGITRLSQQAINDYGLDYQLRTSSDAGMIKALEQAIQNNEWIVVTGWSPHWMFGAFDLRYLEDPKGVLGGFERVVALARKGFYQHRIDAAAFLSRMQIPLGDLEMSLYQARQSSCEQAIDQYIDDNGARIDYWLTGDI